VGLGSYSPSVLVAKIMVGNSIKNAMVICTRLKKIRCHQCFNFLKLLFPISNCNINFMDILYMLKMVQLLDVISLFISAILKWFNYVFKR
jgi:hypothetical protein